MLASNHTLACGLGAERIKTETVRSWADALIKERVERIQQKQKQRQKQTQQQQQEQAQQEQNQKKAKHT